MSRRLLTVLAVVAGVLFAAPVVMAQGDPRETLRDAREAREEARREQAELARQIDVLEATDAELVAALEVLAEQVAAQEREVELARIAVADATAAEAAVRARIETTGAEAARIRAMAEQRAIAAYVARRDDRGNERDITLLARRDALFRYVDLDGRDLVDQLRAVEDDLERLEAEAARHRLDAIGFQADLEAALAQLNADVEAQMRIRAELAELVAELDDELRAMAAAESEINAIIRDAQRQIAREEALARAATSTTTTTAPTATTAPTTTVAPGGGDLGDDDATSPDSGTTTTTVAPPVDVGDLGLIWPTTGSITSAFGTRVHPITGTSRHHAGIDIGNGEGTPIWAARGGTVIFSGRMSGYGETVIVSHGSTVSTLYAHMSARSVAKGDAVSQGQEVGKMGSTGFSTGNHLHFEVRIDGTAIDPRLHLP